MKKILILCFTIAILSQPYSFCTELYPFETPIPKPKISIAKAIDLSRAELDKTRNNKYTSEMIIKSVEYCSYKDIIKKFKNSAENNVNEIRKLSKEGNWEWIITLFNTITGPDYYTYMVTQNGDVLLLEIPMIL